METQQPSAVGTDQTPGREDHTAFTENDQRTRPTPTDGASSSTADEADSSAADERPSAASMQSWSMRYRSDSSYRSPAETGDDSTEHRYASDTDVETAISSTVADGNEPESSMREADSEEAKQADSGADDDAGTTR